MDNWYVVQVRTGREEAILQLVKKIVDRTVLIDCFVPYCERLKRYRGEWHKEQHILFPGYIFLVTGQVEELFLQLKKIPEFVKILRNGMEFIPVKEEEKGILKKMGGESHLSEISTGVIIGDKVAITSGPLAKIKGDIIYIDRHKRMAIMRIEMFDRQLMLKMGLEIVYKE